MPRENEEKLNEALRLLAKERRGKGRGVSFAPFLWLVAIGIGMSLFSYALFDGSEAVGNFAAAGNFFSEFARENEAVAVFLGLDGE